MYIFPLQIMASTVVKAVIGSKVKSLTEDVEGRCAKPLPEICLIIE